MPIIKRIYIKSGKTLVITILLFYFAPAVSQMLSSASSFNTTVSYPMSDGYTLTKSLYGYKICDTLYNIHDISDLTYDGKFIFDCGNWNSTGLPLIYRLWKFSFKNSKNDTLLINDQSIANAYPFSNGFARIQRAKQYNFINRKGEIISPVWFNYVEDFTNQRALVAIGHWENGTITGKFGYIDTMGNIAIPLIFECAESFIQKTARAWLKGKTILIDTKGTPVAPSEQNIIEAGIWMLNKSMLRFQPPEDEDAILYPFTDKADKSLHPIYIKDSWCYENHNKQLAINGKFDFAENFKEGIAIVEKDNKWNFINSKGEPISDNWFDYVVNLHHGLILVKKEGQVAFIERNGNFVIPFYYPVKFFLKNAACIEVSTPDGKFNNIINGKRETILENLISIKPIKNNGYDIERDDGMKATIDPFCNITTEWHYRIVFEGDEVNIIENKGLFKYQNKEGLYTKEWLKDAEMFPEGLVGIKKNNYWGYINLQGKMVIDFLYDDCRDFKFGCAVVEKNNLFFLIDKTGKQTSESFQFIGEYNECFAPVLKVDKWGFINEKGILVIKPQYNLVGKFSEGLAYVKKGKRFGYINKAGYKITRIEYIAAGNFSNGIALVRKGKQNGYIDKMGNFYTR
jgi:hypothetical protein